jgi:cytochrome P450/hemoglobin-like flavoprotein
MGLVARVVLAPRVARLAAPRAGAPPTRGSIDVEDREVLAEHLHLIGEREPHIAERVYERLFQGHPQLRELFGAHAAVVQQDMLNETLVGAVDTLEGMAWLESNLQLHGAMHVEFEVDDEMYGWWTEAILEVLAEVSGADWSPLLARLWRERMDHLCSLMREGARQAGATSDADPGSLDIFDPAVAPHPQPVFRRLRERCPVGAPGPGQPVCVSRYEDVVFALRHPEIFSAVMPVGLVGNKRPLIPLHVDPPEQTKYRKFLDPLFSKKRVLLMEKSVREIASELIDAFALDGGCEFNSAFAIPYPSTVFLRLMGLPEDDLEYFLGLKDGIIRPGGADPAEAAAIREETGGKIYAYFEGFLDELEESPRDDLLSLFLSAEVGGERMSREEILDICFLFLLGGLDTVTSTLGCMVSYLAQHPDRRQMLVDEPSLISSAVEEMLRWETPVVQVMRTLTQDTRIGGVELKKGTPVALVLGSADTDEAQFADADEVDFERTPNKHLAFGGGPHRCLGSHLARMELRVALEELHRRVPEYAIEKGETPVYSAAIREVTYLPLEFGEARI